MDAYGPRWGYEQYGTAPRTCLSLADTHYTRFVFQQSDWDEGWGWEDPCDKNLPLNKTFRALEAIRISPTPEGPITAEQFVFALTLMSDTTLAALYNILDTAYNNMAAATKNIRSACMIDATNRYAAQFLPGGKGPTNQGVMTLYHAAFGGHIVKLSSLMYHEAAHSLKGHNGNTGCPAKQSCDSDFNYGGANTHQTLWALAYSLMAANSSPFHRRAALDNAKWVANNTFVKIPQINFPADVPTLPDGW